MKYFICQNGILNFDEATILEGKDYPIIFFIEIALGLQYLDGG